MKLDVSFVRSLFPAFDAAPTNEWAFFENAGGAYACRPVVDRLHAYMTEYKVQPYGPFDLSEKAGREMDAGYETIAALLNTDSDNLTLGPSTTGNLYVLSHALRPGLMPGDEVVVTNQDHEANVGCWRRLAEFGAVIREWRVDERGELQLGELERLVGEKTKIVCFTLSSNIVGTLNQVDEIVAIAKKHDAIVVGDAVSFAPHWIPDVEATGLDFVLFSTYKTFATHVGVMWGADEALERTKGQGHYFNDDKPHYRLNPTGPMHGEIAALSGLRSYVDALYEHHVGGGETNLHRRAVAVFELIHAYEKELTVRLLGGIDGIGGLRVVGRGVDEIDRRSSVVSLLSDSMPVSEIARRLGERKVAVRSGDFYAVRLIEALGIDPEEGVLRVSMVHYNTLEDVDRLIDALREVLTRGARQ